MSVSAAPKPEKAQIALTLDLEMSRHYPRRGLTEWDYQKGNLDKATKAYSLKAARVAHDMGAKIHFFCVGRVLEQPDVGWLKEIIQMGHPVGNHTYDHVNVLATNPKQTPVPVPASTVAAAGTDGRAGDRTEHRDAQTGDEAPGLGISPNGFRTPGGFYKGLKGRPDLQAMLKRQGFKWISSVIRPTCPASRSRSRGRKSTTRSSPPSRRPSRSVTRRD
ncbi:MAG: hypothetical protein CM1200mP2_52140 [Planctomycetaceae bacterium]|nr:MAG: hypothetical protein CM1200mP2_52140 [Planctomycetaceae bacterium]